MRGFIVVSPEGIERDSDLADWIDVGPWKARTAYPVLVVGMTFDPATNYRGSLEMHRLLPRSRLLTVDGYGHGTFSNPSTCANRKISRYLIAKKLPPKGARCEQNARPFTGNS